RYGGKWICGLCAEAVKDKILHCQKDPTVHLIRAMRRILSRSLESPKCLRSMLT
ncbi:hypothetical protein PHJA_003024700, partial [Phtheirospermum japonicum]